MLPKKPKKYYVKSGIRCQRVRVEFTITYVELALIVKDHISFGSYIMVDEKEITKEWLYEKLKQKLFWSGKDWFDSEIDNLDIHTTTGNLNKDYQMALDKVKSMFPEWFTNHNNKAARFIKE